MALTKAELDAYIQALYDDDGHLSSEDYQLVINFILSNGEPETNPRDLIQIRRGDKEDLPELAQGEMGYCLDTKQFFVGGLSGNDEMFSKKTVDTAENAALTYNSTPKDAKLMRFTQGDDTTPTTDGTNPSIYIQRVDNSYAGDDSKNNAGILIPAIYAAMKRQSTGRGWLYTNLNYIEDASDIATAQSVACAGMAYATGKGAVWGLYGDAYSINPLSTITGAEVNAQNMSGADYVYNEANPVAIPFSCGLWCMAFGSNKNSFGIGINAASTAKWGAGMYFALGGCKEYGIDMQATPNTLINFKYGASVDGENTVFAGIGLDTGATSFFTTAGGATRQNTGAVHLRGHRMCFGNGGWLQFNAATGQLQVGFTDGTGADVVWGSIGSASGWVAGGTPYAGAC